MIVITLSKVPNALRGDLTRWCQEVQSGVYIGNFNAKVRENLWQRIQSNIGSGVATMIYTTNNELGYNFLTTRKDIEITFLDGLPFVKSLKKNGDNIPFGFSNASKFHKSKKFMKAKDKSRVAKKLFSDYVALDLETSGLKENDEIISIGAIKVTDEKTEKFYSLIQTSKKIEESIVELTGITNEDIDKSGISLDDALNDLTAFVEDLPIVGYNIVNFDMKFLDRGFKKIGMKMFKNRVIDLLPIIKRNELFLDNYRLNTVLKNYNLSNENAHNSLNDAEATCSLFEKIKELDYL